MGVRLSEVVSLSAAVFEVRAAHVRKRLVMEDVWRSMIGCSGPLPQPDHAIIFDRFESGSGRAAVARDFAMQHGNFCDGARAGSVPLLRWSTSVSLVRTYAP